MEKHQIHFGNQFIDFFVERKDVKNVNLNIKPDMTVHVSANEKVPLNFIYDFVKSKGQWIIKHIKQFEEVLPLKQNEREYVSGESFKYLGKQYRLRVEQSTNETVKYFRGFIYLQLQNPTDFSKKEKMMDAWYKEKAYKVFGESLNKMLVLIEKYGVERPSLEIRMMKARWGSAQIDNKTILINTELIKAPKYCIDYVILHELVHFKYNNHSDSFYNMLFTLMPDWEKRKKILDEEIVREL
ncbi:SprT family zinc-dependent metalloprotease [Lysinibacillus sp. G4S2]|uniref:M48 family metallopeptidase n=1 Tax=Lysinibacillus sp. G4S2 TaxID=3055859 RepID=UPI0025A1874C|nr:SprT family zinc-dependent metalloprotease [Lysinibacillus sp. G4S2]MDM5250095.1 SprT family zinc-dependent metalloprotease [Lysinibacillus sp. G4S2]